MSDGAPAADDPVGEHRRLLFRVAYGILGSVTNAEEVVQETWLRWAGVDRSGVLNPPAYLVRITTTLALNRLRDLRRHREGYVGPWCRSRWSSPTPVNWSANSSRASTRSRWPAHHAGDPRPRRTRRLRAA